jgi:hypothetical protein
MSTSAPDALVQLDALRERLKEAAAWVGFGAISDPSKLTAEYSRLKRRLEEFEALEELLAARLRRASHPPFAAPYTWGGAGGEARFVKARGSDCRRRPL